MKINKQVTNILLSKGIKEDEAMLYLLALYFNYRVHCIPENVIKKVNLSGIVGREFSDNTWTVQWHIPLFAGENAPTQWDWVQDYRILFKKKNPTRTGAKANCIQRMQWFFSQYPQFRKEDVIKATKAYLATVQDPQYCKSANKFIYEGTGQFRHSPLLEWCERVKEHIESSRNIKFKKMGD